MVNWNSPQVIGELKGDISTLDLILFGIMFWECLTNIWFDVRLIRQRVSLQLATILYWITKYSALTVSVGLLIFATKKSRSVNEPISCQFLNDISTLSSGVTMAGTSSLFMVRTIALWNRDRRVVVPLVVINLGQWGINLHNGFIARNDWKSIGNGLYACVLVKVDKNWLQTQYIYTMAFDIIVLCMTGWALSRVKDRSGLWKLLWLDGLCWIVVACILYLACTIVATLAFSTIVLYMVSNIAAIFCSIVACRSFVRVYTTSSIERDALETVTETPPIWVRPSQSVPKLRDVEEGGFDWESQKVARFYESGGSRDVEVAELSSMPMSSSTAFRIGRMQ